VVAIKHQQSVNRFNRSLEEWEALSSFQRRVMRHQMGLPRSLYKYRSIPPVIDTINRARFEDLVLHSQLWMASVSTFNDPFEGQATYEIPYKGAELRRKWERKFQEMGFSSAAAKAMVKSEDVAHPERLVERAHHARQRLLDRMGMCALSANPSSPLLWAHYAQSHTGLAIQLNPDMDLKALLAHRVEYSDEYPVLSDLLEPATQRNVLPMLRKSPDWTYEQEWRLVFQGKANFYQPVSPGAVGAVILGMRISDADRVYVLDLMDQRERRYGFRPVVYQAERHPRRYRIIVKRLR
jgi:hypothetical protein